MRPASADSGIVLRASRWRRFLRQQCDTRQLLSNSIMQIVADAHLLALADFQNFFFKRSQFGHVAGDLRVAVRLALIVVEHRGDDVGPESAAVAAGTPAFIFMAALLRGDRQIVIELSGSALFWSVKSRGGFADHFLVLESVNA